MSIRGETLKCPECGLTTEQARVPGQHKAVQWTRLVPLLAAVALFLTACAALWFDRFEATVASGHWVERHVPGIDRLTVEAIAAGMTTSPDLASAILESVDYPEWGPTNPRIDAGFGPPPTTLTTSTARGWPTRWITKTSTIRYRDATARHVPIPARTDPLAPQLGAYAAPRDLDAVPPRQRWRADINQVTFSPPPEETGGRLETTRYRPLALLWPVVAGLAIAFAGALLVQAIAIVRRKPPSAPLRTWTRRLAVVCAAAMLLPMLLSSRTSETLMREKRAAAAPAPAGQRPMLLGGFKTIADARDQLHDAVGDDEANRALAQRILQAFPQDGPGREQLYAQPVIRAAYSGDYTRYGQHVSILELTTASFTQTWPFGPPNNVPQPSWTADLVSGQIWITRPLPKGMAQLTTIQLDGLLLLTAGVLVAWLAGRLVAFLAIFHIRSRRTRADRCVACGYDLSSLTLPSPLLREPKPAAETLPETSLETANEKARAKGNEAAEPSSPARK